MSDEENGPSALDAQQEALTKEKRLRKSGNLKPCERCKSQHLKCVYNQETLKCQRCEKSGHDCVRTTKKIRFRDVPVSKFQNDRKIGTASAKSSEYAGLAFVNENAQAAASHVERAATNVVPKDIEQGDTENVVLHGSNASEAITEPTSDGQTKLSPEMTIDAHDQQLETMNDTALQQNEFHQSPQPGGMGEMGSHHFTALDNTGFSPTNNRSFISSAAHPLSLTRIVSSDRLSMTSFGSSPRRLVGRTTLVQVLDQLVKAPTAAGIGEYRMYLETVLLRYFHEELAPWFDLCDPDCHFARVVPQRAREPGPLRSALLTISARNLSRNKRFRSETGIVWWKGRLLPEISEEFAVECHNECIQVLSQLSEDPKKLYDETLLAAVVALRTDEELGHNPSEDVEDQELFLRIASLFVDAQMPPSLALPHSSPTVFLPASEDDAVTSNNPSPLNITESELGGNGLRQACFWTAFRQDLHASFLKQQPVRFPLSRCEEFRHLSPATDAVWANRMVTFCADVLEFCYGSESVDAKVAPAYTNQNRWRELKLREQSLCAQLPATFEPIYCCEPNAVNGIVFPEIWYLEPCHVSGTTYVELARMLLNVFDPTRPKLGHGFLAATNAFIQSTKKILFRLCGIALSNHHCPPSLINACLGISMFGEYFDDPIEQDALLGVLALMNDRYAYPTSQIANSLRRAWNNEGSSATPTGKMGWE